MELIGITEYLILSIADLDSGYCALSGLGDSRSNLSGYWVSWASSTILEADTIQTGWPENSTNTAAPSPGLQVMLSQPIRE